MYKFAIIFLLISSGQRCFVQVEGNIFDILLSGRLPVVASGGEEVVAGPPVDSIQALVGGKEATIEEHPYQVSFLADKIKFFCGGFIVSEDYIITAAHCGQGVDPSTVELRAGSTYRANGTLIPIAEIFVHPDYNHPKFNKDVAVFKTAQKIQFTDVIKPIPLAAKGRSLKGGSRIHLSGWGKTTYNATSIPEGLMAVDVPMVKHFTCSRLYPGILTHNEFCGGNVFLGGQGTCVGDSGGAVTQDGMAVGIVSFTRGCGQPMSPSVFADIASQPIRDFIKEKTGL